MAFNFDWSLFQQAADRKRQNQQQLFQDIQGLGQSIGDIGQEIQKIRQKQAWTKTINSLMNDPNSSPQLKQILPLVAQNPELAGQLLPGALKQKSQGPELEINPDGSMSVGGMPIPGQQMSQQPQPQQSTTAGVGGATSPGGLPPVPGMDNQQKRKITLPLTGNKAVDLLTRPAKGVRVTSPTDPAKSDYYSKRAAQAEVSSMTQLEHALDPSYSARTNPIGAAASSVRRAVNGLTLLNAPTVTNTSLQSVVGDIDSIVTQGAATVEGRKALDTSNVYAKVQQFKAYVASHPENTPVPPGIVNLYKGILKDLGKVSQGFISDYVNQQYEAFKPQGSRMFGLQYPALKKRILNSYDINSQLNALGGNSPQDIPEVGGTFQGGKVLKVEKIQ